MTQANNTGTPVGKYTVDLANYQVGCFVAFFFNDTATTEIYTLSLHDALPIFVERVEVLEQRGELELLAAEAGLAFEPRSEEHTSELQSQFHLVCRLLLEKKKQHPLRTFITGIQPAQQ